MKALRLLVLLAILVAVALTAYRKAPQFVSQNPFRWPPPAEVEPAIEPSEPEPVAEAPVLPPIDRSAQVIVLGYHRFVDKVRHPDTEITTAEFEAQMQALKDQGISVISLEDFAAWRRGQASIPRQSALITIDDGYNVAYSVAWPILQKFGYPFTLFIYTDYIRGQPKAGGGSMSWEQLAEMRDAGVSIQSHSVSHPNLCRKKGGGAASYDDWLWNELHGSQALLEERLGIKVTALALPFGLANDRVRELAAKTGYEILFTVNGEKIRYGTAMHALGRYMVQANQPKLFTTMTTFEGAAGPASPGVATIDTRSIRPKPRDGATIYDPNPLIQADLTMFGRVDPDSVSMRVSGLGEVAAQFDPDTHIVSYQARALRPAKYTVIVAAKAGEKKLEARWSFTVAANAPTAMASGPPPH